MKRMLGISLTAPFTDRFIDSESLQEAYESLRKGGAIQELMDLKLQIVKREYARISEMEDVNLADFLTLRDLHFNQAQRKASFVFHGPNLIRSLALSKSKVSKLCFPLPRRWQREFKNSSIKLNCFVSTLMWWFLTFILIMKSLVNIYTMLFQTQRIHICDLPLNFAERKLIFLPNSHPSQLPDFSQDLEKHDFATWLKSFRYKDNKIHILHSLPFLTNSTEVSNAVTTSFFELGFLNYTRLYRIRASLSAVRQLFTKGAYPFHQRVEMLAVLNEFIKAKLSKPCAHFSEQSTIIFSLADGILKPLWATVFERHGIEVVNCFYALAAEPNSRNGIPYTDGLWELSTWKTLWVVDERQKDYLTSLTLTQKPVFVITGIPYWTDSGKPLPKDFPTFIVMFDSEPQVKIYNFSNLQQLGTFDLNIIAEFFHDICYIAQKYGIRVIHKQKRYLTKMAVPGYKELILDVREMYPDTYTEIDPSIAPSRILRSSLAAVSTPITTPAVIAKGLKIPTIYYDPTRMISIDDPSLRGVLTLSSKFHLEEWLLSAIEIKKFGKGKDG